MRHGGGFDGWLDRVHPADRERLTREMGQFLSSLAREAHLEYRLRQAGGTYVAVEDRMVVERTGDGSPIRLVSVVEERPVHPPTGPWTRYRELFQRTRDAVLLVDSGGRIEECNPAFLELLGLEPAEARGRPMTRQFRDAGAWDRLVDELRRQGSVSDREIDLVAADGSPRLVLASAVASYDAGGRYTGHQAILHDITERRRSQEDQRRRADRLQERVGTLRSLYAISERLAGADRLDPETLDDVAALVPGGLRFPERARMRLSVGEVEVSAPDFDPATAWRYPLAGPAEEGSGGCLAVSYLPSASGIGPPDLIDEEAEFLSEVAGRLTEAARRIQAVEARRREGANHRTLVERSQDLLAILAADATIRYASPATQRLLGYEPSSLVGEDVLELVHPDDREAAADALARTAAHPDQVTTLEHRVRHADGTWRYFESTGRSFLDDADIRGIVVNTRDVTDRRALEEQLRHRQKMEAVGRLSGGVAHEFNNLLTVIRVNTRLLEDHFEGREPPEELRDIDTAAASAGVLTRRLLAFSDRTIVRPRRMDLVEVVRGLEPLLRRMAGDQVELVVRVPPSPLVIRADALQVEQILLDLCENALEAMPEGGRIVLEARTPDAGELPRQVRRPREWALVRVTDTGPGIPEEVRARMFEPFFTTKDGGTGLGLPTVRNVVSRLGGFLELVGPPGGGTYAVVCIPKALDDGPAREPEPTVVPRFPTGCTILVVDGDPTTRSVMIRMLSGAGYRVLEADGGMAALALLEAYGGAPLDLLVTALEMPQVDGEALAARVMATHPEVEVLYLTGPRVHRPDLRALPREALAEWLLPTVEELLEGGEEGEGRG